ncbi:homoserine kinase [candidate division KSB1 bacterium]|nr:homoserine kinase [candidate division KSB1 bacterium]NIR68975.1 homoserine kinase [candidate division KSB1 bacterium]NIS22597.1 homoserine kinase [candidate division KSB1 bacterium]NIT69457.1 homoserine kinase [candidate division KSB1 bacterium]NIU23112.1 homoserine kinase [candidate division KSB1 bacterium]
MHDVKIRVPASTSNLGSGFDCFGLALRLYLTVEMEESSQGLEITTTGEGSAQIPTDTENLIYKSAKTVYQVIEKECPGLTIRINNEIPLFRGLGSSGAATVAGLMCASKLVKANLSNQQLLNLAHQIEGHPENASASLVGGLTINCVENNAITSKRILPREKLKTVLLIPDVNISTHDARNVLPREIPYTDAVFNLQRSALLAHAFLTDEYDALKLAMQDRLHQPFRKAFMSGYDELEAVGYENSALGVCISGSGSTILGLTLDDGKRLQEAWQKKAQQLELAAKVMVTEIDSEGAKLV